MPQVLPVCYAYYGCDTTSAFNGKGKKSAWNAWQLHEDATEIFVHLAKHILSCTWFGLVCVV